MMNLNQLDDYRQQQHDAVKEGNADKAEQLLGKAQRMEDELGTWPDFNVNDLSSLCDQVLKAAKQDLRGM